MDDSLARTHDEPGHVEKEMFARAGNATRRRGPGPGRRGAAGLRASARERRGAGPGRPSEGATPGATRFSRGGAPRRPLWLISRQENGRTEVPTIDPGTAGETLPVFSHEEEAEMFLWFGALGAAWRARETSPGELASLLYGPCANVGKVALDPVPLFGDGAMGGLVSLPREDFLRSLADRGGPPRTGPGGRGPVG